jgi:hypothetical protein
MRGHTSGFVPPGYPAAQVGNVVGQPATANAAQRVLNYLLPADYRERLPRSNPVDPAGDVSTMKPASNPRRFRSSGTCD